MAPSVRRPFVVAWILLGLAGAMNHTIADKLLGDRFDLLLPHLKYGYVMFNRNPRTVQRFEYALADGVHHDLADLVATPAPGYKRARVTIDLVTNPDYLREICFKWSRASAGSPTSEMTIFGHEDRVDVGATTPTRELALRCDAHGLSPR